MPGGVGRGEVDGAALRRLAVAEILRALRIDQLRPRLQVFLVEQRLRAHVHVVDVGHVAPAIGEGELHRLDLQVQAVGAVHRVRAQVEVLEDAERDQRHDALAVGRDLVQRVAAVVHLERLHPVGPVRREVGGAHRAAVLLRRRLDLCGELAAIERLALRGGDLFQRRGMFLEDEPFSGARRAAARQERLGEAGLVLQLGDLRLPLPRDGRRDQEALAAVADRRLEELAERQLAELAVQLDPGRDAARHGDRIPAAHRHGRLAAEVVGRPRGRRAARGVQAVQLAPSQTIA